MGNILPIQDGCLSHFNGLYYLYGVKYQCCDVSQQPKCYNPCAFHNSSFAVYTSPDLGQNSWTLGSADIFPWMTNQSNPDGNSKTAFFESCVLFNPTTKQYVLWYNHPFIKGSASSDSPLGPFKVATWNVPLPFGSDVYFWVDGADAYVKHNPTYGKGSAAQRGHIVTLPNPNPNSNPNRKATS